MARANLRPEVNPLTSPLERYLVCKAMARGFAEEQESEKARVNRARAFCGAVVDAYWFAVCQHHGATLKAKPYDQRLVALTAEAEQLASSLGELVALFPVEDAGFLIGSVYTVMLPGALRSSLGAFYTPPPLVSRLLDMAEASGFNFVTGSAIDPACGGGAFLAPVALRMVAAAKKSGASADWIMRKLGQRLRGAEIDPFAAWMARVLLDAALVPLTMAAGRRLPDVITVGDSLRHKFTESFDLVIGNPPYGRVTLDEKTRQTYARSLFGHANLYGLFTDLALRLAKPTTGVVAYLTPTSFLGGQYFKELRRLLTQVASPTAFDLVADRDGVFDDVLQETLLTTFVRHASPDAADVSVLVPRGLNAAQVERFGSVRVDTQGGPWLLPRTAADAAFMERLAKMPDRLETLGYSVSTGPLVWNRHKAQLKDKAGHGALPIIWAESVTAAGFAFTADRRNHVPYIAVTVKQPHLVTKKSAVLVQRTTSKEQIRRLIAAVMPQSFVDAKGGAVVENHLNMITSVAATASVAPETINALLNTEAVDRAFRCISGSVAVSAYELNAVPLPGVPALLGLERMLHDQAPVAAIERYVAGLYGVGAV